MWSIHAAGSEETSKKSNTYDQEVTSGAYPSTSYRLTVTNEGWEVRHRRQNEMPCGALYNAGRRWIEKVEDEL